MSRVKKSAEEAAAEKAMAKAHNRICRQIGKSEGRVTTFLDEFCAQLEDELCNKRLDATYVRAQLLFLHSAAGLIERHAATWTRPTWKVVAFTVAMEAVCSVKGGGRFPARGMLGFTVEQNKGGSVVVDQKFLDSYVVESPNEAKAETTTPTAAAQVG